MGSWNATCALSHLPIEPGESVVQLILAKSPYDTGVDLGYYTSDFWYPRTLPLFGTYGDYGKVDLGKSESSFVKQIIAGFKVDGIGFELNTWDELEEAFHDCKVKIDKNHLSRIAHHSRMKFYLDRFEEMVKVHGKELEEGTDPEVERRNTMRRELEAFPEEPKVELDPCVSVMIRQDIWDSLCDMELKVWYGTHTLKQYLEDSASLIRDVDNIQKSEVKDPKLASFQHAVYTLRNNFYGSLNESSDPRNMILTALTQRSMGSITPPFQFGAEDMVFSLLKKSKSEKTSQKVLNRFAQLLFISRVLGHTRQAWYPTTGQGSQDSSWSATFEYHMRCAMVVNNLRKPQLQEDLAEFTEVESGEEGPSQYQVSDHEKVSQEMDTYLKWARALYFDGSVTHEK